MEVPGTRTEIIDVLSCVICYNLFDAEERKPIHCSNSHIFCSKCNEQCNRAILTTAARDINKIDCCPVCRQKITQTA